MRISFKVSGSTKRTERALTKMSKSELFRIAESYAQQGVNALEANTPVDSGITAGSWSYNVKSYRTSFVIQWTNSHVVDGVPIAIILQYGHGTGTGGYIQGQDFINPAMKPVFDKIANGVWKAVTSA